MTRQSGWRPGGSSDTSLITGCMNRPPGYEPFLTVPETQFPVPTSTPIPDGPGPGIITEAPAGPLITASPAGTPSSPASFSTTGPPPIARLTADPTSGTAPPEVRFVDRSAGSPTAWAWGIRDGDSSAEQYPVHTYHAAGTYTVQLNTSNTRGSNGERKIYYHG
jgi:PKD repeat protein